MLVKPWPLFYKTATLEEGVQLIYIFPCQPSAKEKSILYFTKIALISLAAYYTAKLIDQENDCT
jgi:hypothetical protein